MNIGGVVDQSWSVSTLHLYLCPPCLLKAHARATTCPVALLATGTQSMDMILHPNMVDICLHSSCKQARDQCNFDSAIMLLLFFLNTERTKKVPYSSDVLKSDWLFFLHNLTEVSKCKLRRRDPIQAVREAGMKEKRMKTTLRRMQNSTVTLRYFSKGEKYRTDSQFSKYNKEKKNDKCHLLILIRCLH